MVADDSFSKTICSICYEDLKPSVEDLQSISICGHVFHELCLQQWFEYNTKSKLSCPVCKQRCVAHNASRLYFQSTGDATDPVLTQSRRALDGLEDSPEVLRREVKKLESKVSALNSTLNHYQEVLTGTNEELHLCKEKLSNEVALKVEALKQNGRTQETLRIISSEFAQSSQECSRLQEKNLALAKELAALKLLSDFNLEEEDILKLATLGNEFNSQDTADVLKKSLFIRNKCYKELMAKCSSLGSGEARSQRKLEKANEKISKLKARIQELEISIEEKDNEVLRTAKASKRKRDSESILNVNKSSKTSPIRKPSPEIQTQPFTASVIDLDEDENIITESSFVKRNESEMKSIEVVDCEIISGPAVEKDAGLSLKSIKQVSSLFHDNQPVDRCFAGGLVGPDGSNRHLGKWCKKVQAKESTSSLIAVGADGRGGRVKVLKHPNQTPQDGNVNSSLAKRCKLGSNTNTSLQSRGGLQLEHFFGRVNRKV